MSIAALANAALVLSSKNWKRNIQERGTASTNKSKEPWACLFTLPQCRKRCCFTESVTAGAPTTKNKIEQKKLKRLRWRLLRWHLTLPELHGSALLRLYLYPSPELSCRNHDQTSLENEFELQRSRIAGKDHPHQILLWKNSGSEGRILESA